MVIFEIYKFTTHMKIFYSILLVLSSTITFSQKSLLPGVYSVGGNLQALSVYVYAAFDEEPDGHKEYEIGLYEGRTRTHFNKKTSQYQFDLFEGQLQGSFTVSEVNGKPALILKSSMNENPQTLVYSGEIQYYNTESNGEDGFDGGELNDGEGYNEEYGGEMEGELDYDSRLLENPYFLENMAFMQVRSETKQFAEVSFYAYWNFDRFYEFFTESKLTREQVVNVAILMETIDVSGKMEMYYAIFNTQKKAYDLFDQNDQLKLNMTLSSDHKEMELKDLKGKSLAHFHELDFSEEGTPAGAYIPGEFITEAGDKIVVEFNEEGIRLDMEKSPYGTTFIIRMDENSLPPFQLSEEKSGKVVYQMSMVQDQVGVLQLLDLKTNKKIIAKLKD